jgi:SAM-dependent methyltransferase
MTGLTRSIKLFRGFLNEQSDPVSFYRYLADDTVREVSRYCQLTGAKVLDVGGASGYVGEAFGDAGAWTLTVEHDADQMREHGRRLRQGALADGRALPVMNGTFDVSYSSNVLEHVQRPEKMLSEMVRAVCPGGIVFVTFTNWYSPWGGHETSPWHYFGGEWAAEHYERHYGKPAKNRFGTSLFKLHVSEVLGWAEACPEVEVLDAFPRYYPHWCRGLVKVPGLRELLTWNLALVMRRRDPVPPRELTVLEEARSVSPAAAVAVLAKSMARFGRD